MGEPLEVAERHFSPRTEELIPFVDRMGLEDELPEYKSSGAGSAAMSVASSSISQSKKATVEIDAAMLQNAVNSLTKIQQEVFFKFC